MATLAQSIQNFKRRMEGARAGASEQGARLALELNKARTARGIGPDGRRYAPYAPSTARRKGRRQPVTLRESDQMMRSLYVRRAGTGVRELRFRGSRNNRIADFHRTGTRHMPARPPLGLTLREARQVSRAMDVQFRRAEPQGGRSNFKIVVFGK